MSRAAEGDTASVPMFSFNGFGTVGVVHSSDDQADFVSNYTQPKGAGFSGRWSAMPDTKLGLQLTANLNERLTGVVQVVSQYQYDATYTPDIEWANLKYQFTRDFSVRVGRIALPTYLYSDSLNVGYVLPNMRIPLEIFAQLPTTSSDGIDASYRLHGDGVTNTLQAFYGKRKVKLPSQGAFDIHNIRGIVDTIEYGDTTVHASYQTLSYDLVFNGTPFLANDKQSLLNLGAIYDPGKWFVLGEWIRTPDEDFGLYYGWYAMAGVRVGKFTPYVGYATTHMASAGSLRFPPAFAEPDSFINQNTSTLGLRWDFMRNVDLKLQYDRTRLHGGVNVFFLNQQPGFRPDGTVDLFSLAVDFIF